MTDFAVTFEWLASRFSFSFTAIIKLVITMTTLLLMMCEWKVKHRLTDCSNGDSVLGECL